MTTYSNQYRKTAPTTTSEPAAKAPSTRESHSATLDRLSELPATGKDLSKAMEQRLNERFGVPLAGLRVYEDEGLSEMGQRGYAKGNEIHLAEGEFNQNSESGRELLYHEVGHVVQQGMGIARGEGILENSSLESQADAGLAASDSFQMPSSDAGPVQGWNPFKQGHQDALDQRVAAEQSGAWDRAAWYKKAGWSLLNPVAAIRAHTTGGKKDSAERSEERDLVASTRLEMEAGRGPKHDYSSSAPPPVVTAPAPPPTISSRIAKAGSAIGDRVSTATDAIGTASTATSPFTTAAGVTESITDAISLGGAMSGGLRGQAARDAADASNLGKFSGGLGKVNAGIGLATGGAGIVTGLSSMVSGVKDAHANRKQGDVGGTINGVLDTLTGSSDTGGAATSIVSSAGSLAGVVGSFGGVTGIIGGGFNVASGGLKVAKGASELAFGTAQRIGSGTARDKMEALSQTNTDAASKEDQLKMSRAFEMGRRNARIQQTQGGFDMASGALTATSGGLGIASGVSLLTGPGALAAPILGAASAVTGLAATGTDLVGKAVTDKMRESMYTDSLKGEGLDVEAQVAAYKAAHADSSDTHARRMVMIQQGVLSGSTSEAHANVADKRAQMMVAAAEKKDAAGNLTEEAKIAQSGLHSMGLVRVGGGFNADAVAKHLGGGDAAKKEHLDKRKASHWGSGWFS